MNEPRPLSLDLRNLSKALKEMDRRLHSEPPPETMVLNEFRQSLDNARLTAWSVSELIDTQRARKDPDKVLAFLSAERLRRLDQLVRNLCGDVERRVITGESYGMQSLLYSITMLQEKLQHCLAEQAQNETSFQPGSPLGSVQQR
ncbi:MAG: hypothetical protein ACM3SW_17990 [Actinomycetota bacterium]